MFPGFACAAFMDAYPEEKRAWTSRIFFCFNLLGLVVIQAGLAFGLLGVDDVVFEPFGGWSFKLSEVCASSTGSLVPFALRNLWATFRRPETLAVHQASVVCLKMDEPMFRLLLAVHMFVCKGYKSGTFLPVGKQLRSAQLKPAHDRPLSLPEEDTAGTV
jgi:hypothetical protein